LSALKSCLAFPIMSAWTGRTTVAESIEGRNPVLEALKGHRPISRILLDGSLKTYGTVAEIARLAGERAIPIERVDKRALNAASLTGAHQGIIAYATAREYLALEDLISVSGERKGHPLYVILDGIEDPQNLGAILRTAEAVGASGVIVRSRRAVGLTPAVARASAGAIEYVPVARVANISQTIDVLKRRNIWVVGIDMAGHMDYTKVDFRPATAIVIGGEGKGLSPLVKKRCDLVASIPMKGRISSLNASVAAAVVLYEALRQRQIKVGGR
jgi:23S rRNA (guanosine2251-2'-O)-methyltransferase